MHHEPGRSVALRMLHACFGCDSLPPRTPGLEPFQAHAHQRLRHLLERRGGAILADSVGLGKTHVAVALIRDELDAGGTALVAAPAQLRAHWTRHLRGLARSRWVSHTALSRGTRRIAPATLIVVDEAHAFRNPRSRRYAALALLCTDARVLLLTATPVNNSLLDFYNLVRIFAARDLFTDLGVPDLLAAVESAMRNGTSAEVRRVADAVMVRRTRSAVMSWQSSSVAASPLRFPVSGPIETVHYDVTGAWPELLGIVRDVIPSLAFPAHGLAGDASARELLRLGLLKRLESSSWAFRASVRRHIRLLDHFVSAAGEGLLFDAIRDRSDLDDRDGAVQLSLRSMSLRPWPASLDRARLVHAAGQDLRALRRLAALFPRTSAALFPRTPAATRAEAAMSDPKLVRLTTLLDDELGDETVLLFTEYQETARGLWRALSHRPGIALVHGSDARLGRGSASRRAVIERFAPRANHARTPRAVERVRLLIATDVLAEGLNLQDARVVISYDLPWNPVRLAQRIGRIDRLGSPHTHIRALAFVPDRRVDEMLGLMKRIRRKLRHIRIVGGDAPWSLAGGTVGTRTIDEIDAAGDARERARAAWREVMVQGSAATTAQLASATPCAGAVSWNSRHHAALCCFCIGGEAVLVLTADGRTTEIGSATCWTALADALVSGDAPASSLESAALAAERRARRALRRQTGAGRDHRSAPGAGAAGAAVLRWLADRPGGATREEAERADGVLRRLSAGRRAGQEIHLERALRGADSTDEIIASLLALPVQSPGAATGTRPRQPDGDAAVRLVAVLLIRPVEDSAALDRDRHAIGPLDGPPPGPTHR